MKKVINYIIANKEKVIVLTDQGIVSGVNFLVGILLARFLGLSEYGLFALGWMVVLFASSLHQAFIVMPLYTLLPKQKHKAQYLASLMGVQVLFSVITFFVALIVIYIVTHIFLEWNRPFIAVNIALVASLFVFNDYLRRLFFAMHRPTAALLLDSIGYGFQPLVFITLAALNKLTISTAFMAINSVFILSITVTLLSQYNYGIQLRKIQPTLKLNFNFSKYLVGTALLQWVSGNFFIVVAGGIVGPVAVGAIRIAQNIVGVLHVLFLAMENLVPVRAAELLNKNGKIVMLKYIGKIAKQSALPAISLLMGIILFRNEILELFYGIQFLKYHTILLSFCGLYMLVFVGTLLRFIIRAMELNKIILVSYIATTIFSLLVAKPLVTSFELTGVMIGLFSAQIVTISIYIYSLKTELKWIFK